jgi:lysophospholipid acyltransferase (LPLAT)-like uncharacterized protein
VKREVEKIYMNTTQGFSSKQQDSALLEIITSLPDENKISSAKDMKKLSLLNSTLGQ